MPRGRRSSRFAMLLLVLPLLLCRCGSEEGNEVIICYPEQLAAGTYDFSLVSVGDCLKPYESAIRGFFTNVPMVLPGYADLPDNVELTLLDMQVTGQVSLIEGNLVLTNINPEQIEYNEPTISATITNLSGTLCPVSGTRVDADLVFTIQASYPPFSITCPNASVRVTGTL